MIATFVFAILLSTTIVMGQNNHNTPVQALIGVDGTMRINNGASSYRTYQSYDWPGFDFKTSQTSSLQACAEAAAATQKSFFTYNATSATCNLKASHTFPGSGMTVPFSKQSVIWGTFDSDFDGAFDFYDANSVIWAPKAVPSIGNCQDYCIVNAGACVVATFSGGYCYMKQPVYSGNANIYAGVVWNFFDNTPGFFAAAPIADTSP
ncbi:hypothetical protein BC830DRAFT_1107139 [Chytriomyces sp. MP71]|nr:hypothetical protein BC830DRAFT_1107139 [Chytriomyces sp. MP71]